MWMNGREGPVIREFWNGLTTVGRFAMAAGVALLCAATLAAAVWLMRADDQVVFSDLAAGDAAVLVAELERQKIPYRLGEGGTAILVDRDIAHKTRIKLMGKNLPLHGTVGFELFNTADFGMTEFAQRVNYQRALQGELTRTILSLAEIADARVHLVLPEEGLFKRSQSSAKASITLALRSGRVLQAEQVLGIQRLVAASVPGISVQDVTLIDQHGLALTRSAQADPATGLPSGQLDLKKETEQHLARKAGEVLERAVGAGQALVSVDVLLSADQVRTTTEDVLGAPGQTVGVVTRERDVTPEGAAPLDRAAEGPARRLPMGASQHDVDYAVGRRVEQVATPPGSVRRLQVVAVVSRPLTPERLETVRALLGAAVGAVRERGDTVVVYALDAVGAAVAGTGQSAQAAPARLPEVSATAAPGASFPVPSAPTTAAVLLLLVLLFAVLLRWQSRRGRAPTAARLTPVERQLHLAEVQHWFQGGHESLVAPASEAQP